MAEKFTLDFGALCESIAKQLKAQGYVFFNDSLKYFQSDADDITRLHIRGYLSDSLVRRMRKRLISKIGKNIRYFRKIK